MNTDKYRLKSDGDGHWFIYPHDKEKEVNDYFYQEGLYWLGEIEFEPARPDYLKQIDGPHRLTFEKPKEE